MRIMREGGQMKVKHIISEVKWYLMWMVLDPAAEFLERHWWARAIVIAASVSIGVILGLRAAAMLTNLLRVV